MIRCAFVQSQERRNSRVKWFPREQKVLGRLKVIGLNVVRKGESGATAADCLTGLQFVERNIRK